ncbi:MAG: PA0069 family radical SAM protein [Gammaproteobacteria bacterium]|nr:PA0069 family radical SAM protein [Gammaproteobacteria bacterium]MDE2251315.1 PA0069 family radical SAM protein [Gammaproteobacteria bacterium]
MAGVLKGRGATINPAGRFALTSRLAVDDGWYQEATPDSIATEVRPEAARSVISRNDSPDIPFAQSINPYRGCEHGCVYCYARPSHAYVDLSPGIDFETRLFYKADAARLLRAELARPAYRPQPIMLGANTDPYQPAEKRLRVTREILEVLWQARHPLTIITKGALVLRDLELLQELARLNLVRVTVSLTTLDPELKRTLEPRAASPQARLKVIAALAGAGVPVGVLTAPLIPAVNDAELESLLEAAAAAGATSAGYVLLRLPHEVKELFRAWLERHLPLRAAHVMSLVQQARGGRDNDPRFGHRMRGAGPWAAMLRARFELARRRLGLDGARAPDLDSSRFCRPQGSGQMELLL